MKNRWMIAAAGMGVMMTLGTIYSWSLFTQPLIASFGWSNATTTWTFALAIFSLGLGALVGGRWQDRVGPRVVALTGVALWGGGNLLAGLGTAEFGAWWMYLTYGIVGGFGVGMGYITPVAVVTKWFPDKRGLGGGMVVMGFGLGALFYNLIVKSVPSFSAAATAAAAYARAAAQGHSSAIDVNLVLLTPGQVAAVMHVFAVSGVAFLLLGAACAWFLTDPPRARARLAAAPEGRSYSPREMLHTPQFYLLWLMLFLNVTAGILVISNALPIMQELTGEAPQVVAAAYGGVSLFNALGRFFWGAVSDRIGRNRVYFLIFAIQVVVFLLLGHLHAPAAVALAYAAVLLCYGGGFGTMPSFNADYFGTRHMGANYGAILTAWGVAGIAGPMLGAEVKDITGSFSGALPVVAMLLLPALALPLITRKPAQTSMAEGSRPKTPSGLRTPLRRSV